MWERNVQIEDEKFTRVFHFSIFLPPSRSSSFGGLKLRQLHHSFYFVEPMKGEANKRRNVLLNVKKKLWEDNWAGEEECNVKNKENGKLKNLDKFELLSEEPIII